MDPPCGSLRVFRFSPPWFLYFLQRPFEVTFFFFYRISISYPFFIFSFPFSNLAPFLHSCSFYIATFSLIAPPSFCSFLMDARRLSRGRFPPKGKFSPPAQILPIGSFIPSHGLTVALFHHLKTPFFLFCLTLFEIFFFSLVELPSSSFARLYFIGAPSPRRPPNSTPLLVGPLQTSCKSFPSRSVIDSPPLFHSYGRFFSMLFPPDDFSSAFFYILGTPPFSLF